MSPAQPEVARQLALYAISVSGSRRSARSGDWGTLAIASALAGRNIEATRAFFVEVALTSNLDRTCQTALSAYHSFGNAFASRSMRCSTALIPATACPLTASGLGPGTRQ